MSSELPTHPASPGAPSGVRRPEQIGPYRILQVLGEGGMGVVYVAEQTQPVRRRVALKVIKPGMEFAEVVARFEAERQALALMDHPNIAKVLDAGRHRRRAGPYFVMELVQGVPITEYCDAAPAHRRASGSSCSSRSARRSSTPTRRASSTATSSRRTSWSPLHDGRPVPKVIDFGDRQGDRPAADRQDARTPSSARWSARRCT